MKYIDAVCKLTKDSKYIMWREKWVKKGWNMYVRWLPHDRITVDIPEADLYPVADYIFCLKTWDGYLRVGYCPTQKEMDKDDWMVGTKTMYDSMR